MNRAQAEEIALKALAWLSNDPEKMSSFLGMTGADVEDVLASAQNPDFLGFVLDFVLMDDSLVLGCSEYAGVAPENFALARQFLPGGEAPEWT